MDDAEHLVDGRDHGALAAFPQHQRLVTALELAAHRAEGGLRAFRKDGREAPVALDRPPGTALAAALVVARAQPGPRREMVRAREGVQVRTGLGEDGAGRGQWEAPFAFLRPLTARDPRAGELLFATGMISLALAHLPGIEGAERDAFLDVSIAAFRAILAADPEQNRVRLELARAFFLKRQDGLARRQFERVLAGDGPAPVVANVNRFLAEIRARRRWSAYGGVGLAPDTNIGATRAQRAQLVDTPFGRLRFTPDEKPTSGGGVSVWGG